MGIKKIQRIAIVLVLTVLVLFSASALKIFNDNPKETTAPSLSTSPSSSVPSTSEEVSTSKTPEETTAQNLGHIGNANPTESEPPNSGNYFADVLFVGDSRTVGLQMYSTIKGADYFASVGLNVYKIENQTVKMGEQQLTLKETLARKNYGKIYVMLGINELGYNRNTTVSKFTNLINSIAAAQPQAKIFIQANIHVSAEKSQKDSIINNKNINAFNSEIKSLANGVSIFYIDPNEAFDDGNGNLASANTSDGIHLYPKKYDLWKNYILNNKR